MEPGQGFKDELDSKGLHLWENIPARQNHVFPVAGKGVMALREGSRWAWLWVGFSGIVAAVTHPAPP